jgi:ribosomal subunit interface protein
MEPGRGTVKSVHAVRVLRIPRGLRVFATADGFLYGMMRLLCGVLVEAGRGRLSPRAVQELLAAGDRSRAPPLLPAHALFLWKVRYEPLDPGGRRRAALDMLSRAAARAPEVPGGRRPPLTFLVPSEPRMSVRIDYTDRHQQHPETVKTYAVEKAEKVARFYDGVNHIQIVLDRERDKHSAELIVRASHNLSFVGHAVEDSVLAAIDGALEKLERQVKKAKERLRDHHRSPDRP